MEINKNKLIVYSIIGGAAILMVVLIMLSFLGTGTITVSGRVENIDYTINEKQYAGRQTIGNLKPGSYKIVLLNRLYLAEEYNIKVTPFSKKNIVFKNLEAKEEDAIDADINLVKYFDEESKSNEKLYSSALKKYPLIEKLPFFGIKSDYIFDYNISDNGAVDFYIESQPGLTYDKSVAKGEVDKFIVENKLDINKYIINYR